MIIALRVIAVMAYGACMYALGKGWDGAFFMATVAGFIAGCLVVWED